MPGKKGSGYPTQPAYPTQPQGYPTQPPGQYQQGPMPAAGYAQAAPPPYAPPGAAPGYAPPQYPPYNMPYGQAPPAAQYQMAPPGTTVHVPNAYDAGARFDSSAAANIPPPPPGVMPNAAQMATAQGNNVVMGQRQGDFWSGGSSGGYNMGF